MSLTTPPGPLAGHLPETVNYRIDGPAHQLHCHDFPRRVRARFAGETVLDTLRGKLLHETGLLPVLYVPAGDVRTTLLEQTGRSTHCPFKGEASYWTVRVGDRVAENAVWGYQDPLPEAAWLRGYLAFYWEAMEAWYDEDEQVYGHLRDPFHRVDVRASSRRVRVLAGGEVVAESTQPRLLSETGLPNRWYLPAADVRRDLLQPSDTRTVCPYKGTASYWSLRIGGELLADAAWSYPDPLEDAAKVRGYLSFGHDAVTVEAGPPGPG
jgi:uncharacterized protein (DUF427 family)